MLCKRTAAISGLALALAAPATAVPVNLAVTQDAAPEPSGYYVDDHLALSVLAPNVPIPASTDPNATLGYWAPAWSFVGQEAVGPGGSGAGADVLFNADWNPVGGAPGTGGAPNLGAVGGGALGQLFRLVSPDVTLRGGRPQLGFQCLQNAACRGFLQLQNAAPAGVNAASTKARKPRVVTYATTTFSVAAGRRKTLSPALSSAGRQLLRSHRTAHVYANFTLGGARRYSRKITLHRR
jgi:hypothetical protein